MNTELSIEDWHDVYKELAKIIGKENTIKLYNYYKGQQLSFPSRIYDRARIIAKIKEQYDGNNIKQIAREYGYSERWIRKLIREKR